MKYKELKQKLKYLDEIIESMTVMFGIEVEENKRLKSFITVLEKQLAQQDKAIERKDAQFLGLRSAYADEIINNQ